MHHNIKYDLSQPALARAAALKDIEEWMGTDRFKRVCAEISKMGEVSLEKLELMMSFAGIGGYPVRALHEHLFPGKSEGGQ